MWLEKWCENIDAGVFFGDLLEFPGHLKMLEDYITRWSKAIVEHKETEMIEHCDKYACRECPIKHRCSMNRKLQEWGK